ncbi:MAG: energy transducer TonB [Gemmatimonadales bacterium]
MKANYDRARHRLRCVAQCVVAAAQGASLLGATGVASSAARAQSSTRVSGVVVSVDGERIAGAQVRVAELGGSGAVSDDGGRFEFFVLGDSASRRLVVRRIGFRPETLAVRFPRADTLPLEFRLVRASQLLSTVTVKAEASDLMSTAAQVRDRQKRSGNGYFVYRDQIIKMDVSRSSDVLRRIPGVRIATGGLGQIDVRLRANNCSPLFWVNGMPLVGLPFDPDQLTVTDIEAIEIYPSAATVPVEFRGPIRSQGCGSIVVWTREGERRTKRAQISADSIYRLVDAARIFLPEEVDSVAKPLTIPRPDYPDSLYRAKVAGAVVAEFIVDTVGAVVQESIGIVSSSHVPFADAVRLALREATFTAAVKRGHPVAQVVQLPFSFTPPAD